MTLDKNYITDAVSNIPFQNYSYDGNNTEDIIDVQSEWSTSFIRSQNELYN